MKENEGSDSNIKSITKDFVITSLPTIALSSISAVADFVGTFILAARYGEDGVAAGGLFSALRLLLEGFICSFFLVVGPLLSSAENDSNGKERASSMLFYGVMMSLAFSIPMITWYWYSEDYFLATGQDANASRIAGDALSAFSFGCWSEISFLVAGQVAISQSEKLATLLFLLAQKGVGLALSYYLVDPEKTGANLGASGLGYATAASSVLSLFVFIAYLFCRGKITCIGRRVLKENKAQPKEIALKGWSVFFHRGIELAIFSWMIQMCGQISESTLTAVEISSRYAAFPIVIGIGISHGISMLISKNINDPSAVSHLMRLGYLSTSILSALAVIILNSPFNQNMIDLFMQFSNETTELNSTTDTSNATIPDVSKEMFIAFSLNNVPDNVRHFYTGAFWGNMNTRDPMIANIIQSGLGLSLAYLFLNVTELGAPGIFYARGIFLLGFCGYLVPVWEKIHPTFKCSARCCSLRGGLFGKLLGRNSGDSARARTEVTLSEISMDT